MPDYTIEKDGDNIEKRYWKVFVKDLFPNYEKYWQLRVAPLTDRPTSILLKESENVIAIGGSEKDIHLAQMHYSILHHLIRSYEIRQIKPLDNNSLIEGFIRLCSGLDLAIELIYQSNPNNKTGNWETGQKFVRIQIKEIWKKIDNNKPDEQKLFPDKIDQIRKYRNYLTHNQLMPSIKGVGEYMVPAIGKSDDYKEWRKLYKALRADRGSENFVDSNQLLNSAWITVVKQLNIWWEECLLKDKDGKPLPAIFNDIGSSESHVWNGVYAGGPSASAYFEPPIKEILQCDTNAPAFDAEQYQVKLFGEERSDTGK